MKINKITSELSSKGYWPAVAQEYLDNKKYARVIELCTVRLKGQAKTFSGRIIYAQALYHSGQNDIVEKEFYKILQIDPNNLKALKYLGDIKFDSGDSAMANSYYDRVLQIDPNTSGLCCSIENGHKEITRVLTIKKGSEKAPVSRQKLRELPFKTETVGELLLAQGHPRLALSVFRELAEQTNNPRLQTRVEEIENALKNKD